MTQIGFVTMVLLPPAMMEDQKLITKVVSARAPFSKPSRSSHFSRRSSPGDGDNLL